MKEALLFILLVLLFGISLIALTQIQPENNNGKQIVHAELMVHDNRGNLVTYIQSYRFDINQEVLDGVIRLHEVEPVEEVMGTSRVITKDGQEYQEIKIVRQNFIFTDELRSWNGLAYATESEKGIPFIRFFHDGITLQPGDIQTIFWTITTPI